MPPTPPAEAEAPPITVSQLILRYWRFAQSYYVKDGKATSEQTVIRQALRFVRKLYGSNAARDFSPNSLKAVRQAMIEHQLTTKIKVLNPVTGEREEQVKVLRHGLCRKVINKQIGRIKRMFAWAVEEELVPVTVHQALMRVRGLKKGKQKAREKPRVKSVLDAHVDAILPLVPRMVRAMIEIETRASCFVANLDQVVRDELADLTPQTIIPAEDRTRPMTLQEAARLMGLGEGITDKKAAQRLRDYIKDGTILCQSLSRQKHYFRIADFPIEVRGEIT